MQGRADVTGDAAWDADHWSVMLHTPAGSAALSLRVAGAHRLIDRGGSEETYRKASVEFAVEMLEQAGFADRQIIAPPGYSRPLVIGRVSSRS